MERERVGAGEAGSVSRLKERARVRVCGSGMPPRRASCAAGSVVVCDTDPLALKRVVATGEKSSETHALSATITSVSERREVPMSAHSPHWAAISPL